MTPLDLVRRSFALYKPSEVNAGRHDNEDYADAGTCCGILLGGFLRRHSVHDKGAIRQRRDLVYSRPSPLASRWGPGIGSTYICTPYSNSACVGFLDETLT